MFEKMAAYSFLTVANSVTSADSPKASGTTFPIKAVPSVTGTVHMIPNSENQARNI
jgi:hypothetical protein